MSECQFCGKEHSEYFTCNPFDLQVRRIDQLEKALSESQAYADKLAEGLPMLPKDVEVIRTANVHLADDVCRLEKALREIVERPNTDGYGEDIRLDAFMMADIARKALENK
jgi:hypothetical protein